jgi:hypothetical protein
LRLPRHRRIYREDGLNLPALPSKNQPSSAEHKTFHSPNGVSGQIDWLDQVTRKSGMGFLENGVFRNRRGWTLNMSGHTLIGLHVPLEPFEIGSLLPKEFELQTFQDQAYLSIFLGHLFRSFIPTSSTKNFADESPCMMITLPVVQGEMRGWLVQEIGITDEKSRVQSERFLNLPLLKEGWRPPTRTGTASWEIQLPTLNGISLPKHVQGTVRPLPFFAQPDSIDSFLTSQPNFLWQPSTDLIQVGPIYLPPMPIQRIQLEEANMRKGMVAHFMHEWELIAWRPQRLNLKVAESLT